MSEYQQGYLDVPICDHCLRKIEVGDKYVEFIADKPLCLLCIKMMPMETLLWFCGESIHVRVVEKPAPKETEPIKE